ncbi:hypothetical protein SmJEL517_g00912 [Synchytrium microbalum]|uniref:Kinesin motor domain-containing protein n=1 Tax=Synchytrium microbalum TaxID=1806994 RepID=A0A507CBR9_9FUNG|nr:uncharacterized protein SmJEL517_g00912 [Synchytrium microbalum]TPX36931.1 hypothetical protein SmJEL517_g00912 [Synchytrium microbalum]
MAMAMGGGGVIHTITAEKETNIHVVVRVRPRSAREIRENSPIVITTSGTRSRELNLRAGGDIQKTYGFDKVFGPEADQDAVFTDVVAPILEEVLMGYNCTIFAYGQTGTGKTYTMEGDLNDIRGRDAGIIPRTLHSLFDTLESDTNEYSVRVSGSVVIQGLEELLVKNAEDVIAILQRGSVRRQTAATKMNEVSSRSHCIFSITVHIKETTPDGEELLKVGKMNLVDLAGSENIGRSGAEKNRAKEAGMINQSLLTLGRVINALVDRSPHIPYRESKLTRLLQDSLGGRTKTCIIAAGGSNLEESMSTLDYAHRAKNIRNKPEVNQKMTKKALIREYINEIERLKADLLATREKNGIFLSPDSYNSLMNESQSRKDSLDEVSRIISSKDQSIRQLEEKFQAQQLLFNEKSTKLDLTVVELGLKKSELQKLMEEVRETQNRLTEQMVLTMAHAETEKRLNDVASGLVTTLSSSVEDVQGLHDKIDRKAAVQNGNMSTFNEFRKSLRLDLIGLESQISTFHDRSKAIIQRVSSGMKDFSKKHLHDTTVHKTELDLCIDGIQTRTRQLVQNTTSARLDSTTSIDEIDAIAQTLRTSIQQQSEKQRVMFEETWNVSMQELTRHKTEITEWASATRQMVGIVLDGAAQELSERLKQRQIAESNLQASMQTEACITNLRSQISALEASLAAEREAAGTAKSKLVQDVSSLMDSFLSQRQDAISSATVTFRNSLDTHAQRVTSIFTAQSNDASKETASCNQSIIEIESQSQNLGVSFDSLGELVDGGHSKLSRQWEAERSQRLESAASISMLVDGSVNGIQSSLKKVSRSVVSSHDRHVVTAEEEGQKVTDALKSVQSTIEASTRAVCGSTEQWSGDLSKSINMAVDFATNGRAHIQGMHGEIDSNQLAQDLPTGTTPRKRSYKYPTSWALTKDHDELLQEFRTKQNDDTLVNNSPNRSRESSLREKANTPTPSYGQQNDDLFMMGTERPSTPNMSKLPKLRKLADQTPRRSDLFS